MTRVADRSSSNGSSVAADTMPAVFDIATESGTLALLRAIHRSGAKQRTRNELRDLIFALDRKDPKGVKTTLAALTEAGFTATCAVKVSDAPTTQPTAEKKAAPTTSRLGRQRGAPQFAPVKTGTSATPQTVTLKVTSASAPVTKAPAAEPAPNADTSVPSASSEPEATQEAVVEPKAEVPAPEPTPEPKPLEAPAPEPTLTPKEPVAPAPKVAPAAAPTSEPTPTEPPAPTPKVSEPPAEVATSQVEPMERIKEIKRLVNEKVGNPITLIDTDNQVGREYMNSLLAAMKVANGGKPEEVKAAMERLEKAFTAAMAIAGNAPKKETATDKFVNATVAATTTPTPTPTAPKSGFDQPAAGTPVPAATAADTTVATPPSAPATPVMPSSTSGVKLSVGGGDVLGSVSVADKRPQGMPTMSPAPTATTAQTSAPEPAVRVAPAAPAQPAEPATPTPAPKVFTPPPSNPAPITAAQADATRLMSVAKEEQIETLMRQKKMEESQKELTEAQKAEMSGDPLMSSKVTAGLKQLLSEWSLFKSSGFFGTGPGGMDHPLYKLMAPLSMAAVIAGRFEGATPQIKQSITDYMNGWRYEEGIVHEHTETFEHYLRRVIKHILEGKENPLSRG